MNHAVGTCYTEGGLPYPNDDQVNKFCDWLQTNYYRTGIRGIGATHKYFRKQYGYVMKSHLKQYDAIKHYISQRLNVFAKKKWALPPFKEKMPPSGALTRAMKKKRGRPKKIREV